MLFIWSNNILVLAVFVATIIMNVPASCDHVPTCPEILTSGTFSCKQHGNVKNIIVINKSMADLTDETFARFKSVILIKLNNNSINSITKRLFRNMTNLRHLSIHYNMIDYISDESFGRMQELTKLLLDNNRIINITENAFEKCCNLIVLGLENNYIEWIDENAFGIHNVLKILNVSNNLLADLGFLKNLIHLQELNASFNNISTLQYNTFENMSNLRYLYLSHNFLTVLPSNVFHKLRKLNSLYLSHNKIINITSGTFELNLKTLTLNNNKLQFIDQVFNNISEVHLQKNFLNKLLLPKSNITLHIDDNTWDCGFVWNALDNPNVKLLYTKHTHVTNLRGVSCRESSNAYGSAPKASDYYWNTLIIVLIVLGSNLLSLSLILTIYFYYKKKHNLENHIYTEPTQNESAYSRMEMGSGYLTPICEHHYEELNFYSQAPV